MNSESQIKPFIPSKDIWSDDLVSCEDTDDCSPQVPKITHQFSNTLKTNKGKSNKEDFNLNCLLKVNGNGDSQDSRSKQASSLADSSPLEICISRAKKSKAKTYIRSSQKRYLNDKEVKLLRKISSSEILKMLLT
ncbi:unnamed protein product [Moneuplotes crassus]|uniref:Uncharacterized protein n=1 Tax=Euplotes crassus TaxID=5936 RepID=A0AAD1X491_EUPCR|nr:unnamed protein product [Moneuplotes crassus]